MLRIVSLLLLACCASASQWFAASCSRAGGTYIMRNRTAPGHFTEFVEGPVVDKHGNLFAVNMESRGTIAKIPRKGDPVVFARLPEGCSGNGMRMDAGGNLFVADVLGRKVLKVILSPLSIETFAQDSRMAAPNDLAITSKGIMFLSDPIWDGRKGNLWRIDAGGTVSLLDEDLSAPNGIEVSHDGRTLYVGEYGKNRILAYKLSENGEISERRIHITFPSEATETGPDGIRSDICGQLYVALYGAGVVAVVSPEGKEIDRIHTAGKKPTNVAFGGYDGKTLYVTVGDLGLIQSVRVHQRGRAYCMWHKKICTALSETFKG